MTSTEQQAADESFEQGFHGIPDPKKRASMSPEKLAIELSKLKPGDPPYILLSHELNLRLAKEQSKATLSAGWYGAIATVGAALLTLVLGYYVGTSKSKELDQPVTQPTTTCNCTQNVAPPLPAKNDKQTSTNPAGNKP